MGAPFLGCDEPEICARVIHAYLKRLYTRHPSTLHTLKAVTQAANPYFSHLGSGSIMFSAWLSFQAYSSTGMKLKTWTTHVIMASRAGYTFRRCLHFEYKANRDYPRVTNRGVVSTTLSKQLAHLSETGENHDANSASDNGHLRRHRLDYDDVTERCEVKPEVVKRRLNLRRGS